MTNVRDTSIAAYHGEAHGLGLQQQAVLDFVVNGNSRNWTRCEIATTTGIRINAVCGRVHELVKAGLLKENEKRACEITGRVVHALAPVPA